MALYPILLEINNVFRRDHHDLRDHHDRLYRFSRRHGKRYPLGNEAAYFANEAVEVATLVGNRAVPVADDIAMPGHDLRGVNALTKRGVAVEQPLNDPRWMLLRQVLRTEPTHGGNKRPGILRQVEREPVRAAKALRGHGVNLAIVKQGPAGVLADDGTGITEVPPVPVTVENGIGAGDAFGGALCHGLLAGWDTARTIRYANAAGAIVASRLACSDAMPTTDEIDDLLGEEDNAH